MASHHRYNNNIPQPERISSLSASSAPETFIPNYLLPQKSHISSTKKHFFFSTSNIRFWTTGQSGKKISRAKLSNSAADVVNHGDQLHYVKKERNILRRLAAFLKLKFKVHFTIFIF